MYQEVENLHCDSFLSDIAVVFYTVCKDDNISLSQAQASANMLYSSAQSMYQEVENLHCDSFLSDIAVVFHSVCKDDKISLS